MFVEQLNKNDRTRIGSLHAALSQRVAINSPMIPYHDTDKLSANDNALPIAPVDTGVLGSTRVNTPRGPVAIIELSVGQSIITSTGESAQVAHIIPAIKPTSALRIRAPYFGANQDFVIAKNQYLEIKSDIAEYMFGQNSVCVPAWVFKDNSKVLYHELEKSDEMYQLQVKTSDGIGIGECNVTPLLVGSRAKGKRLLNDAEARAFAFERRIGQYN